MVAGQGRQKLKIKRFFASRLVMFRQTIVYKSDLSPLILYFSNYDARKD